MPGWMQAIAAANPVNWALDGTRAVLTEPADWGVMAGRNALLLALAALMAWLSTLTFRGYQRTV